MRRLLRAYRHSQASGILLILGIDLRSLLPLERSNLLIEYALIQAHGQSKHSTLGEESKKVLDGLLVQLYK